VRIRYTKRFNDDLERVAKHPEWAIEDLDQMIDDLFAGQPMPDFYREHTLQDRRVAWAGYLSLDLSEDLRVLIRRHGDTVTLHRIGGHRALYGWRNARSSGQR